MQARSRRTWRSRSAKSARTRGCRWPWASASQIRNKPGWWRKNADAVVVGSAVVNQIAKHGQSPELVKRVGAFVKSLVSQ